MHESEDLTYLVLQLDMAPRVCIQNLTSGHFSVVECTTAMMHNDIDACCQRIPAHHEVSYEPPSLARLYPIVFDEEIASEKDKRAQLAAKNVKIKLRCVQSSRSCDERLREGSSEGEIWSSPLSVAGDQDRVVNIPGFGGVLVSTDTQFQSIFISLLPTRGSPQQLSNRLKSISSEQSVSRIFRCDVLVSQLIVSLFDNPHQVERDTEILRLFVNKAHFSHCNFSPEGAKMDFVLESLRIDNMMNQNSGEFAVAFLPRSEHAARPQLIQQELKPLLKFLIHYNPQATFQVYAFSLCAQPVTIQLEDSLLQKLKAMIKTFRQPELLQRSNSTEALSSDVSIPASILQESVRDAFPLTISNLVIETIEVYVSANITLKVYLSCSDTPFRFSRYELSNIYSNWSEVSQVVAAKYISALYMHIGWVLGSLELIGSPVTFMQSVGRGLRDLVSLPYEGITRSPSLFISGIGQGTTSFLRQFSSGALTSVTNLASSIARNMERLSMDEDHMTYQDRQRRERPTTHFTTGVVTGVSSFSLSLLSAVAGLVDQPMQSIQQMDESGRTATTLLKGVGKGLLGVVTKPVGGAMDLVSKTGQGIMHSAGLAQKLEHYEVSDEMMGYIQVSNRRELLLTNSHCLR